MKTIWNFAIAITLLATGSTVCMADSTNALIAEVKECLPKGWTVHELSRNGLLEITKDAEVLSFSTDYIPSPDEKPTMRHYSFCLRIQDEISDGKSSEQWRTVKELDGKIQELHDGLVARAAQRVFDNFVPKNDEEKALVHSLEDLRWSRARLPDYFIEGRTVIWILNSPKRDNLALVGDAERRECKAVQRALVTILTKHSRAEQFAAPNGP